jgi:hypothetical protein
MTELVFSEYNAHIMKLYDERDELRALLEEVTDKDYDCGSYYHDRCGCLIRLQHRIQDKLEQIQRVEEML